MNQPDFILWIKVKLIGELKNTLQNLFRLSKGREERLWQTVREDNSWLFSKLLEDF